MNLELDKSDLLDKLEQSAKSIHEAYEQVHDNGPKYYLLADDLWFAWINLQDTITEIYDRYLK